MLRVELFSLAAAGITVALGLISMYIEKRDRKGQSSLGTPGRKP